MKVKRFLFVMLLAIVTAAAALLGACVEEPAQVKITKITSMSEINSLLGDDFSVEAEARAAVENFYDEISEFSYENGGIRPLGAPNSYYPSLAEGTSGLAL